MVYRKNNELNARFNSSCCGCGPCAHHLNLELAVVLDQWDPVKDINDLDIWNTEIINIEYTFNWTQLVLLCTTGTPPYILILIHARARIQPISGFCFSGLFQLLIGQTIVAFPFPSQMINHPLTTTMPLLF